MPNQWPHSWCRSSNSRGFSHWWRKQKCNFPLTWTSLCLDFNPKKCDVCIYLCGVPYTTVSCQPTAYLTDAERVSFILSVFWKAHVFGLLQRIHKSLGKPGSTFMKSSITLSPGKVTMFYNQLLSLKQGTTKYTPVHCVPCTNPIPQNLGQYGNLLLENCLLKCALILHLVPGTSSKEVVIWLFTNV